MSTEGKAVIACTYHLSLFLTIRISLPAARLDTVSGSCGIFICGSLNAFGRRYGLKRTEDDRTGSDGDLI